MKIAVILTEAEIVAIRSLIVDEARHEGWQAYQHVKDLPARAKLLRSAAEKLMEAREYARSQMP